MDFSQHVDFPENLFAQEVDGEMVLLDMNSENYFGLDTVATDIWRLLQEGRSLDETMTELMGIYDVDEVTLRQDMEAFVTRLTENGLATLV